MTVLGKTDPLLNCNFSLRVNGITDLPLKSVHGFETAYEYDYIQEGGLNEFVHFRRKQASSAYKLEIERYVGTGDSDPLSLGKSFEIPLMLFVSRKTGNFVFADRTYVFIGAIVSAKSYGELDAKMGGDVLLVDRTTILYQKLLCVDL